MLGKEFLCDAGYFKGEGFKSVYPTLNTEPLIISIIIETIVSLSAVETNPAWIKFLSQQPLNESICSIKFMYSIVSLSIKCEMWQNTNLDSVD